jgi:LacI family transcriptional regulator
VGAAKRKKIQRLIERYRYIPNPIARSLVTRKTHVINVVIPSVQFFEGLRNSQTVIGLQEATIQAGYRLVFTSLTAAYKDLRPLEKISADGIVVYYWGPRTLAVIKRLKEMGLNRIVAIGQCTAATVSSVYQDSRTAMHALTKHVLACGHRNIVYADAFYGDIYYIEGCKGIRQALAEVKNASFEKIAIEKERAVTDEPEWSPEWYYAIGRHSIRQVLKTAAVRPTVIMYDSDVVALGAMEEAKGLGLAVPRDLSITGTGNDFCARISHPPVTTIEDKSYEAGLKAGEMLIAMMDKMQAPADRVAIPIAPIIRSSVSTIKEK